jgi:hypothetical protein
MSMFAHSTPNLGMFSMPKLPDGTSNTYGSGHQMGGLPGPISRSQSGNSLNGSGGSNPSVIPDFLRSMGSVVDGSNGANGYLDGR